MKIFPTSVIKEIDSYTIKNEPIKPIDLMERAAGEMAGWLESRFGQRNPLVVFAGPGNNGGDGMAVARMMSERHYAVTCYLVRISDHLSSSAETNLKRLKEKGLVPVHDIRSPDDLPSLPEKAIILDAIFGSGLTRPVEGMAADLIRHLNGLPAQRISIDIPSGLFGEDNAKNKKENIFRADVTLTLQFPKRSFFFAENRIYTGEWYVLPIGLHPEAIEKTPTDTVMTDRQMFTGAIPERDRFSHKGHYGHALLISGSYGMMGAAVLGAKAALRMGAGLVTVHVPRLGCEIIQSSVPEALVSMDQNDEYFSGCPDPERFSAVGVGPGIGRRKETARALKKLLENIRAPLVIDADALNILSENKDWLDMVPGNSILTPHPKEFDRLAGNSSTGFERNRKQVRFSREHKLYVILKGAYTCTACPDGSCYFNNTGNPGMAIGGSGDVLTGMILSLLCQRLDPLKAALTAVYLHGLAGDLAAGEYTENALLPSDITAHIGKAIKSIKSS